MKHYEHSLVNIVKQLTILLISSLLLAIANTATAEEKPATQPETASVGQQADQLVGSKAKADMTYQQLMEIMGEAYSMIQTGVVRQNQQMVKSGADIILNHPAPNHQPWTIVEVKDQDAFKQSLLDFDKILDEHAGASAAEAAKGNWPGANKAAFDLSSSCIACHSMWKDKVK